jgi:serine/threonine-protein kinase
MDASSEDPPMAADPCPQADADGTIPPLTKAAADPPVASDATLPDDQDTVPRAGRGVRRGPGMPAVPGYEVIRELGRGGMGVVYEARHLALDRIVALKMILRGVHAGAEDLARFRAEAEAVARLQHPNVVQVYEIGDHDGLPFIALEYCGGGSLHRKLAGQPLPPPEAARLAEQLAIAMEAAHRKHIIHRDLKPQNVLLTDAGEPKVTDFGLAKKLDARERHTQTGVVMGTPSYMAPEQARGEKVGPAADIYALGAILYECLTGRPPFLADNAYHILSQVLYLEPVAVRRLQPGVPRDLETICHSCLRKEPARRYASAAALAEDVGRFRRGEPIQARPVGRLTRAWKWARRRPAVATLTAALLLTGAVAFGLVTWKWIDEREARALAEYNEGQANRERDAANNARFKESVALALAKQREKEAYDKSVEAEQAWKLEGRERVRAEQNAAAALRKQRVAETFFRKAQEAVEKMLTTVSEDGRFLRDVPGFEQVRRKLLEEALRYHKDFLNERAEDPLVGFATAWAYYKAGEMLIDLGRHEQAEMLLLEGVAVVQKLVDSFPDFRDLNSPLGGIHSQLARSHILVGRFSDAEPHLARTLELRTKMAQGPYATVVDFNDLAAANNDFGLLLAKVGKLAEAEKHFLKAKVEWERLAAKLPGAPLYRMNLGKVHHNLASVLDRQGQTEESLPYLEEGARWLRTAFNDDATNPEYRLLMARALADLAKTQRICGQTAKAEEALAEGLEIAQKLLDDFPSVPNHHQALGRIHGELGMLWLAANDYARAIKSFNAGIEHYAAAVGAVRAVPDFRLELATFHNNLALCYSLDRGWAKSLEHAKEAVELRKGLRDEFPDLAGLAMELADSYTLMAGAEAELRDRSAAAEHFKLAGELQAKLLNDRPADPKLMKKAAMTSWSHAKFLVAAKGADPEALSQLQKCLDLQQKLNKRFPNNTLDKVAEAQMLEDLGQATWHSGDRDQGLKLLHESLSQIAALAMDDPKSARLGRTLARAHYVLGTYLRQSAKTEEAVEQLEAAAALYQKLIEGNPKSILLRGDRADACTALGLLLLQASEHKTAEKWLREAHELRRQLLADYPTLEFLATAADLCRANLGKLRKAMIDECDAQLNAKKALSYFTACERLLYFDERSLKNEPDDAVWKDQYAESSFLTAVALVAIGNYPEGLKRADGLVDVTLPKKLGYLRAGIIYAQSAATVGRDPRLASDKRDLLSETYAKKAVAWLSEAVDAGFDDVKLLRESPAFAPLRERDDFRALMERLEKK